MEEKNLFVTLFGEIMEEQIVNRVAKSPLINFDLSELSPKGKRIEFDLKDWLYEGIILREKDFRESLEKHDWSQYKEAYVSLHCSTEAILPSWSFLLVTVYLQDFVKKVVLGSLKNLESEIFNEQINLYDFEPLRNKKVIIKGCSENVPESAYIFLIEKLHPIVQSLMYGEACSTVPLFKRKKSLKS